MAYPDICTLRCRNWGTEDCPNSAKCLATEEKPYFQPKAPKGKGGWLARLRAQWTGRKGGKSHG